MLNKMPLFQRPPWKECVYIANKGLVTVRETLSVELIIRQTLTAGL